MPTNLKSLFEVQSKEKGKRGENKLRSVILEFQPLTYCISPYSFPFW